MPLLHLLPAALVAYLWASAVFAATIPMSSNDPFRAIAAQVPQKPNLPVCCLKPIQPLEPLEDEVLLSFEEWKQKQTVLQEKERAKEREANNRSTHNASWRDNRNTTILSHDITSTGDAADVGDELAKAPKAESLPPHFRVPLVDRFNYASVECSARVHLSHRSAKSASSILSSKRDRYMLSPCNPPNQERQFVVVELCEDIRIDTVQLANFEFFSGIFKDFRISVAKTDITGEEQFTDAGVFRAKNVRGVQSFHPPTSLRDFYRYIRIDFLSHYGNEYYCPLSLLRVYGLTHLEQWKWDTWEQESRAKMDTALKDDAHNPSTPVDTVGSPSAPTHVPDAVGEASTAREPPPNLSSIGVSADTKSADDSRVPSTEDSAQTSILSALGSSPSSITRTVQRSARAAKLPDTKPTVTTSPTSLANDSHETSRISSPSSPISALATDVATERPIVSPKPPLSEPATPSSGKGSDSSSFPANSAPSDATITTKAVTTDMTSSVMVSMPAASQHPILPPTAGGGESIYRTIMNRLTALEANHTLYARYVEQQTSGVRELLKRLGEDVGRLEGIGKAQSQTHQRQLRDWEKRQMQMQMDYGELMARVEGLSDDIILEKRLGIAQLCLLLAVLVFMGLTRGSRGDDQRLRKNTSSMREWGKRHLRFSGDWTGPFRGRRSGNGENPEREKGLLRPLVQPSRPVSFALEKGEMKVEFPTAGRRVHMDDDEKVPLRPKNMNTHNHTHQTRMSARSMSSDARFQPWRKPRSRTPSLRNAARARPPGTPTSFSTHRLQRSNSHSGPGNLNVVGGAVPGPTHKSARKWARTAHLHEVRTVDRGFGVSGSVLRKRGPRGSDEGFKDGDGQNVAIDVFGSPGTVTEFWTCQDEPGNGEGRVVRVDDLGSPRRERGKGKEPRFRPVQFEPPDVGEGDPWVDTELDESEAEWELKLDTGRSMSFPAAGNEH